MSEEKPKIVPLSEGLEYVDRVTEEIKAKRRASIMSNAMVEVDTQELTRLRGIEARYSQITMIGIRRDGYWTQETYGTPKEAIMGIAMGATGTSVLILFVCRNRVIYSLSLADENKKLYEDMIRELTEAMEQIRDGSGGDESET